MEHWSISTQALLFGLVHWHGELDNTDAKKSSGDLLAVMLRVILGQHKYVMYLKPDMRVGSVLTDGSAIDVQHGSVSDLRQLAGDYPVVETALKRTAILINKSDEPFDFSFFL